MAYLYNIRLGIVVNSGEYFGCDGEFLVQVITATTDNSSTWYNQTTCLSITGRTGYQNITIESTVSGIWFTVAVIRPNASEQATVSTASKRSPGSTSDMAINIQNAAIFTECRTERLALQGNLIYFAQNRNNPKVLHTSGGTAYVTTNQYIKDVATINNCNFDIYNGSSYVTSNTINRYFPAKWMMFKGLANSSIYPTPASYTVYTGTTSMFWYNDRSETVQMSGFEIWVENSGGTETRLYYRTGVITMTGNGGSGNVTLSKIAGPVTGAVRVRCKFIIATTDYAYIEVMIGPYTFNMDTAGGTEELEDTVTLTGDLTISSIDFGVS